MDYTFKPEETQFRRDVRDFILKELPKNFLGKIQRRKLRENV